MLTYTTGDLLESPAQALVNTVNCEGYMGKGIAYQFKLQFPENNVDYINSCKDGSLEVGKLHYSIEKGKIIINFPTKDKWREKSKIGYIEKGLDELLLLIEKLNITSLAIPPLGSGNGGLVWTDVRTLIEQKLSMKADEVDIYIYEPSHYFSSQPVVEPKLSTSALVLMEIKGRLTKFSKQRLQKTAYFTDLFLKKKYFNFKRHKFGPYDYSIELISKKIKEFQKYHGTKTTNEAKVILLKKIISESVESKMAELMPSIERACIFVNGIKDSSELECLSTICFLVEEAGALSKEQLLEGFIHWSEDKADRFPKHVIIQCIDKLYDQGLLEKNMMGYIIAR